MRLWIIALPILFGLLLLFMQQLPAAVITNTDSTQPRGAPADINDLGQDVGPLSDGLMSPHQRAEYVHHIWDDHYTWSGNIMANSMRDPGFMAMLNVVNKTFINYVNAHEGDPKDPSSDVAQLLKKLGLEEIVTQRDESGKLQPEEQIPVVADLCLRCHSPAGWLEGHSEPYNDNAPFLKGQFWGSEFTQYPGDPGHPRIWDAKSESEAEVDGVQCDVCHRMQDNYKVQSNYDGSWLPSGNAGYIFQHEDILDHTVEGMIGNNPNKDFVQSPEFCGTCHNVTNPLFKTKTEINGTVPDVLHPVERTYTEWYWSDFGPNGPQEKQRRCHDCHQPMKFLGAQTWMIDPGLGDLWGDMDEVWTQEPYSYDVPINRTSPVLDPECNDATDPACWLPGAYPAAAERNREFMKRAAKIEIIDLPDKVRRYGNFSTKIRVTNNTGHKLPTGYPEGRRMWIDIKVIDQASGWEIFRSGKFSKGNIVKAKDAKIYEMVSVAEGYEDLYFDGHNILDLNKDGKVTHKEKEFHFILGNKVEKDNRIPPAGFNKEAYMADAAFIVPRDKLDNDYPSGQNWDDTDYEIRVPWWVRGPLKITATLKYQTFSKDFVKFLKQEDDEDTQENGGRARNIPKTGIYGDEKKWGKVLHKIWKKSGYGEPVEMASVTQNVDVSWGCGGWWSFSSEGNQSLQSCEE